MVLFEKQDELLEEVSMEVMDHLFFHQFKGGKRVEFLSVGTL